MPTCWYLGTSTRTRARIALAHTSLARSLRLVLVQDAGPYTIYQTNRGPYQAGTTDTRMVFASGYTKLVYDS